MPHLQSVGDVLPSFLATLEPFGISLAEWGVIALALAFAAEVAGFSRSTRTVRNQNADLRERNATLEGEVRTLEEKVSNLERQVDELKSRNVDALFDSLRDHDARSAVATATLIESLSKLTVGIVTHDEQAAIRFGSLVEALDRIANDNKGGIAAEEERA